MAAATVSPDLVNAFNKTRDETPVRPAGPSYGQLSYLVALLSFECRDAKGKPTMTKEIRQALRTREGASAMITLLKDRHQTALDAEKPAEA